MTTATYWRPSGKNIHRFDDAKENDQWGVQPDEGLELKLTDSELLALMEDRRQRDIVLPKPEKPAPEIPGAAQQTAVGQPAPAAQSSQPNPRQQEDGTAEKAPGTGGAESGGAAFVDRQLQLALKHLPTELAKPTLTLTRAKSGRSKIESGRSHRDAADGPIDVPCSCCQSRLFYPTG